MTRFFYLFFIIHYRLHSKISLHFAVKAKVKTKIKICKRIVHKSVFFVGKSNLFFLNTKHFALFF
jgi:hypothetical protein